MSGLSKVLSVRKVTYDTSVPVYDIEVPKYSNFVLSNGLVVHNSKDAADAVSGAVYSAWLDVSSDTRTSRMNVIGSQVSSIYDDGEDYVEVSQLGSRVRRANDIFSEFNSLMDYYDDED